MISQLDVWKGHLLWIMLDSLCELRLVVTKMHDGWCGTLAEGTQQRAYGQRKFPTEAQARAYVIECLQRYMERYDYQKITSMARTRTQLVGGLHCDSGRNSRQSVSH